MLCLAENIHQHPSPACPIFTCTQRVAVRREDTETGDGRFSPLISMSTCTPASSLGRSHQAWDGDRQITSTNDRGKITDSRCRQMSRARSIPSVPLFCLPHPLRQQRHSASHRASSMTKREIASDSCESLTEICHPHAPRLDCHASFISASGAHVTQQDCKDAPKSHAGASLSGVVQLRMI